MKKGFSNSIFLKGKALLAVRMLCALLVCFGLVLGGQQEAQAAAAPAPVLESVQVVGTDFVLKWSQPSSTYGAPDGGYDIHIDGVDTNKTYRTTKLTRTISGLAEGTHRFRIEARFTEANPKQFPLSNEMSATLTLAPPAPVLNSVQVSGTDFILTWSQPDSTYGAPDGGYDIFIDGVDTNATYRTTQLSKTISGLAPGTHTFKIEARFTESTEKYPISNEMSATSSASAPAPAPSGDPLAPVLSVQVSGSDIILSWSQPDSAYGAPDGGYDIFIDGVDQNNHLKGLSATISGLAPGTHTFQVEARFIEASPKLFPRSAEVSATLEAAPALAPAPEPTPEPAPTTSGDPLAPVLSVQVSGSDVILSWSQPDSAYGAPDGGYDIFIDGVDQNNHLKGLSATISGLASGTHTFQVEARFIEASPKLFPRSAEVSATLEAAPAPAPAPEPTPEPAPTTSGDPLAPVLSVQVSGSDIVLAWSQPDSVYGAPDGGYDIFIDGVDQNNHIAGPSATISGLASGTHTFQVEARFIEASPKLFSRSAEVSATLEASAPAPAPEPTPEPTPEPAPAPDPSLGYLPVFPGAQGFGTETKAGRGGKIIKVTNLNDSGSGSLREAVNASGPRIIVFEVSGTIKLSTELAIRNPYVTIAGQTAPSPGITLRGATFNVNTHDALIQHLRVRVGDDSSGQAPEDRDGLKISGWNSDTYNIVLDHLSVSWALDEGGSAYYDPHEITISNTIISEGLYNSIHPKGSHSMGFLAREGTKNLSFVGSLFAHNNRRNPRIVGDTKVAAVNNLFYNTGESKFFDVDLGTHGTQGPHLLSVVGNTFIEGPDTPNNASPILVSSSVMSGTKIYQTDNVAGTSILKYNTSFDPRVSSPPVWHPSFRPIAGKDVESRVLANVGARPADRDSVDERVVNEVKNRGGSIIDATGQVGGWPNLAKNTRAFNIPSNPNGDDDGDGYTNIEEILHQMAAQVEGRASM